MKRLLLCLLVAAMLFAVGCSTSKPKDPTPTTDPYGTPTICPTSPSGGDSYEPSDDTVDLMKGFSGGQTSGRLIDDAFVDNQLRLAAALFTACYEAKGGGNVLISPLSIQLALAMTANGADGATREEMETLLGGEMSVETLNEYLKSYLASLTSGEKYQLSVANSIWFRNAPSFTVNDSFLQTNADYYGASAYKSPFDDTTLQEINAWVNEKTDGMIPKILDEIKADDMMYLINAILFDAEWETPYDSEYDVREGTFTAADGKTQTAEMLWGEEYAYLSSEHASGFVKDYAGGRYSFAAVLPEEGMTLEEYMALFDAKELGTLLDSTSEARTTTAMPKFSYDFSLEMSGVLAALGMPTAFGSGADFSELGRSTEGNLYISSVVHKTFIAVDALGTRAGAVTSVTMSVECAPQYAVVLDRPFLYMILDNETNLPIFIGTLASL